MIAALMIGREGSVAIPGKNVMEIDGLPLMVYPILAAQDSHSVDEVYLSTDSEKMRQSP